MLYGIFDWLESEATANMCNGFLNMIELYETLGFAKRGDLLTKLNGHKDMFRAFDKLIAAGASEGELRGFLSDGMNLWLLGHCMATQICGIFGAEALAECAGDCLKFIQTYYAAGTDDALPYGYAFNSEFLEVVSKLQSKITFREGYQ
jgi:hypothetical protein